MESERSANLHAEAIVLKYSSRIYLVLGKRKATTLLLKPRESRVLSCYKGAKGARFPKDVFTKIRSAKDKGRREIESELGDEVPAGVS